MKFLNDEESLLNRNRSNCGENNKITSFQFFLNFLYYILNFVIELNFKKIFWFLLEQSTLLRFLLIFHSRIGRDPLQWLLFNIFFLVYDFHLLFLIQSAEFFLCRTPIFLCIFEVFVGSFKLFTIATNNICSFGMLICWSVFDYFFTPFKLFQDLRVSYLNVLFFIRA